MESFQEAVSPQQGFSSLSMPEFDIEVTAAPARVCSWSCVWQQQLSGRCSQPIHLSKALEQLCDKFLTKLGTGLVEEPWITNVHGFPVTEKPRRRQK